jgi:ATP-binding cassette subfamily B protein
MTRVTTDVDVLNELFTAGVVSVFGDIFLLIGIMGALAWMDWRLAAIAFAVLPLIAMVTQWFRRNVRDSYRRVRTWIARINSFLQEHITGMSTVQLFRREARSFEAFDAVNRGHRDANIESIYYYAVFYPAIEVIGAMSTAMIIWFGGNWVMGGTLTVGSFVAFVLYSQRFYRPISDLSEKFNILQAAMASSERIFKLLDTPAVILTGAGGPIPHAAPGSPRPPRPSPEPRAPAFKASAARPHPGIGHIVFDDVSFAYNGSDYVLEEVSFEVRPGQRVGIVGATGAGKSTIINLLLRFYDVHLFSGTIASNIRLGEAGIDDEALRVAATAVHADTFIESLPAGYAAPVAERGATLSVGQKQLLSFARALAFDPRILVLDEATSSVDTETELLIRDALHTLMAGRTTIAIAHRLSTIQDMDTILVFHRGRLREEGTHQELLAKRGIYYKLVQLQYREG